MHLLNITIDNKFLLNNKQSVSERNQHSKLTLQRQLQQDIFERIAFKGYDRLKLSSDEILQDVARRLLESIHRPLTERKQCNKAYLPLHKNARLLGEYKLDIATGVRFFRVVKYPDHYELHKNVFSEPGDRLTKVNVLKLFPEKVIFHSLDRNDLQDLWGDSSEHLETTNNGIIKLYNKFFSHLEDL